MKKKLIQILGGARSGKSTFAEKLAGQIGDSVLYVATATASDDEMQHRIAEHRRRRPAAWQTAEIPLHLGRTLREHVRDAEVVLIDCLSVLLYNVMFQHTPMDLGMDGSVQAAADIAASLHHELDELLACYRDASATFVVVSNEVGLSIVPPYPLGRIYRDLLGWANQRMAGEADEAYIVFAGIPVELKALSKMIAVAGDGRADGPF